MAAARCISACRRRRGDLPRFKAQWGGRKEKRKGDLGDFEHDMVVGATEGCLFQKPPASSLSYLYPVSSQFQAVSELTTPPSLEADGLQLQISTPGATPVR